MKYYKIVNSEVNEDNIIYRDGYNEYQKEINTSGYYKSRGIEFAREDIFSMLSAGDVRDLYEVEPIGDVVKINGCIDIWKSNAINLKYIGPFWDNIEFLIEQGGNINSHYANIVGFAIFTYIDSLNMVKYLVSLGSDIHSSDEWALRNAASFGKLDVVKYLVNKGADIHVKDEQALCLASEYGHLDVVKYLVEHEADIHACDDWALRLAIEYSQTEVVEYLKSLN